ncbi:transglutaminaseTgpA domain-containing protein [Granulicoccus sp. GXG6511]|uniref:transglutaminase family protein n=1 Tax=Granulicoccus sp. GXG6511 TaxID=3381351 RepID=UPI003D7E5458
MAAKEKLALMVSDRFAIAVTVAVLLASLTLLPLTQDGGYLALSSVLVLILGAISLVLRRFRLGDLAVLGFQSLALVGFAFAVSLGLGGDDGNPFSRFVGLFGEATNHLQTQSAPMEPNPGVRLLFVTAIGVIMILTDVMVQGVDRPMWSLAPLASLFLVPALALQDDVPWWCFVVIALGYLGILLAEGINTSERWPRGVRRSQHDRGSAPLAVRMAALVGVPAIVLTLALGLVIPTLTSQGWGLTRPQGDEGPLQMADPTLDLRRNINQPTNRVVMRYTTDQPDGVYLRMASLPVFNATGWQNAGMQLTTGTSLPPPPGHRAQPGEVARNTTIQVTDFRSQYLPLPFAPAAFSADGQWAYDRDSLVVLATGENYQDAIRDLTYSVRSLDIKPDGPGLSRAMATGNPPDSQLTVPIPQDIPDDIVNLTLEVTRGIDAPALQAAAIQNFLRNEGGFTYSTEPLPGSGYEALQNFLFDDKKGYCEQFAGAMAAMARVSGIPSRVAVGFLPGERQGEEWSVSIRDMHAWPELWFEGYGWVRFEPTPTIASPPPWTVVSGTSETGPDGEDQQPEEPAPVPPAEEEGPTPEPTPEVIPPGVGEPPLWQQILKVGGTSAGIAALVAAVASLPMLFRSRRRSRRLSGVGPPGHQVENAWAEIRDSVVDYGGRWPAGSPRVIGTQVAHDLDAQSAKAMTSLSLMVERARYSRHHPINADLSAITHQVRRGLADRSRRQDQLAATWWPRSLWNQLGTKLVGSS